MRYLSMPFSVRCLGLALAVGGGVVAGTSSAVLADDAKPMAKVTFEDHVLPIFRARCGSCHNANDKKGSLVVDDYAALMAGGSSGTVVEGGDADSSYLWGLITHESEPKMPPNGAKLPDNELAVIKSWIEGGLLKDAGSKAKLSDKPKLSKVEIVPGQRPADIAMPLAYLGDPTTVTQSRNAVTALACSPWAPLVAVSGHRQIALYNTQTLQLMGVLPFPEGQPEVLRFSRTGDLLMVGGGRGGAMGKVVVFDVKTGDRKVEAGAEYDSVLGADISPDQTMIALGGPKKMVRVYSTVTGELLYENKKHTDWVTSVAFSPDGVLLATGDRSNGLVVWEAVTGRIFYDLQGHKGMITDISWRPDSNVLASSCEDGNIKLWEMENGREIKNWGAHGGGAMAVNFTREGQLVSTGRDKVTRLWNGDGAKVRDFGGMTDIGMEVAYDAETKRVFGGDWTGIVRVWNADDGAELGQLGTNPPTLAMLVDSTTAKLAEAKTAAEAKASQVAALQKQMADKQAAADKAVADFNVMTEKAKQLSAAKVNSETQLKELQTALAKGAESTKQATALMTTSQQNVAKAVAAVAAATTVQTQAQGAFDKANGEKGTAEAALVAAMKAQADAVAAEAAAKGVVDAGAKAVADAVAEKVATDAVAVAKSGG
ncbi:MAG: c-type cytochrome domain-containing protein [Planctomycetaceae bacterium]